MYPSTDQHSKLTRLADRLDAISEITGRAVSWLVLALTLLVCWDVAARYFFHEGSIALQELEWHLFAIIFLLSAAYTLKHDSHVRVEILYNHFSKRGQLIADMVGIVLFLLPFSALVIWASLGFVETSFSMNEGSPDPGGLPFRWLLKSMIPAGFALLIIQGIADFLHRYVELKQEAQG